MEELALNEIEEVNGGLLPFLAWLAIDVAIWSYDAYLISKM
jgi:hypothetical protein